MQKKVLDLWKVATWLLFSKHQLLPKKALILIDTFYATPL